MSTWPASTKRGEKKKMRNHQWGVPLETYQSECVERRQDACCSKMGPFIEQKKWLGGIKATGRGSSMCRGNPRTRRRGFWQTDGPTDHRWTWAWKRKAVFWKAPKKTESICTRNSPASVNESPDGPPTQLAMLNWWRIAQNRVRRPSSGTVRE